MRSSFESLGLARVVTTPGVARVDAVALGPRDAGATVTFLAPFDRIVIATGAAYRFGLGRLPFLLLDMGAGRWPGRWSRQRWCLTAIACPTG